MEIGKRYNFFFFAQERDVEHLPGDPGVLTLYIPLSGTLFFFPSYLACLRFPS